MKTTPVTFDDLSRSVLAVPPLARNADLSLNKAENGKLIRHLHAGGVTTLMYGGNANFYHLPISEFAATVAALAELAAPDAWIIPSVGPDYGRLMDSIPAVREAGAPTVMVLPCTFPAAPAGVARGVRLFAEKLGTPVILYIKSDNYVPQADVAAMIGDGLLCGIKYATVLPDPGQDPYLSKLVDMVDRRYIISGIGERPAIVHLRDFGLQCFTSGSVCVAPAASTRILNALKAKDYATAEAIRSHFLPLEDQRDGISPIRVLHEAVTLSGIADMGPMLPLLANIDEAHKPGVKAAADALLAYNASLLAEAAD